MITRLLETRPPSRWIVLAAVLSTSSVLSAPGSLISALDDIKGAMDKLVILRQAADDALAGKRVTAGSDWAKLAEEFDNAARAAQKAPLPSRFTTRNSVSAEELTDCTERADVLRRLRSYRAEMQQAQSSGRASVEKINLTLARIPKAEAALRYLQQVHEKLVKVPPFGEKFAFDWVDIEAAIGSLGGTLQSALKEQTRRYDLDLNGLDRRIGIYDSNMALISRMECSGEGTFFGIPAAASLRFGGGQYCPYALTVSNLTLVTEIRGGSVISSKLTGTFSERPVGTGACAHTHVWGSRQHQYSGTGKVSGSNIHLEFRPIGSNLPKCSAVFNGSAKDGHLSGSLVIHRTDQGNTTLAWTTTHQVN